MKRPSFQFYPADWRKDAALQSCCLQAQGLWINIMCIAHECEPYGHLVVNGKPMNQAQIGRLVGVSQKEAAALLLELEDAGVLSSADNGAIFSRRMVRDEEIRNARAAGGNNGAEHGKKGAEHGSKGGRPRKETGVKNPPSDNDETGDKKPPLYTPPSSSSSSSPSVNPEAIAHGVVNSAEGTSAGTVCARLKSEARMTDMNPSHPRLLAMLEAGMTADEIISAGIEAVAKGKGFLYALATAEGRRRDAANVKPLPDKPAGAVTKAGQATAEAAARWLKSEGEIA